MGSVGGETERVAGMLDAGDWDGCSRQTCTMDEGETSQLKQDGGDQTEIGKPDRA